MTDKKTSLDRATRLRKRAEEVARKKAAQLPENIAVLSPEETRRALYELRVHQIELEMQNEELRRTQEELETSRARYFDLYDLAPVGYCTLSEQGLILESNLKVATLLGVARGALVGQAISRFILKEDQDIYYQHRKRIFETGEPQSCELRMAKTDGTIFWARIEGAIAKYSSAGFQGVEGQAGKTVADAQVCRVVLNDITERIRSESILAKTAEDKFKSIFDHAGDGILLVDPENKRFYIGNNAICRMLGYSSEEINKLGVMDICPEKDGSCDDGRFAWQTSGHLSRNIPVKRKDGSVFYADVNSAVIAIAGKKYITAFFHDITERKQAEADLALAHRQLKNLIDSASQVSIIATDRFGKILVFNRGAECMLGYSAREMVGKQTPVIIHLESEMKARGLELTREMGCPVEGFDVLIAYAKRDKYDEREWTYVKKDGKHLTVDLIVTGVKDEFGKIDGFLGIAIDITDRKLALQAQAASVAKSQFVANISHEIRTPLNGIIGVCELLLETKLSDQQLEYARIVNFSAETLFSIINATLDFSKIEAGKIELESIDFNLRDTVEDIAGMFAVNVSRKKLELICVIEPDVPLCLRGDPSRLRQILFNLIGNAMKFTSEGEVVVRVELVEEKDSRAVLRFSIRDTGIGVPSDKISVLFNSFTQADTSLSRKYGGTGLGLAISKGLAEKMGGSIGVESAEGKGSTFWFVVPFLKQKPKVAPAVESGANFKGVRILIVDDNATNRLALAGQLRSWKIDVEMAGDGAEALAKMRSAANNKRTFAVALIDSCMPEMDGVTLGKAVKADSALKNTILFLMSSMAMFPETYIQNKHLFAATIIKPVRKRYLYCSLLAALKGETTSAREEKGAAEPKQHEQYRIGNRLNVLVAEDNLANQKVTLSILENMGHWGHVVANGREALQALETMPYDLVLMDVQMPEMDGLEATAIIRDPKSQVRDHAIPILALTAYAMEGDRERCLAAGMNGYIAKPVSIKAIADAIAKIAFVDNAHSSRGNVAREIPPCSASDDPAAVFDSKAFSDRLRGRNAPMSKIIDITLDTMPKYMSEIEQAVQKRCQDDAGRLAHNIRGCAANVGANRFLAVAVKLEAACKTGEWRAAEGLLPESNRQFAILERTMREFQKTLS